jgi:polysaccharide export outer membrane protein
VPDVTVIVSQVHASRASVLGQVNNPGRFELGQRTTVLDAIAMAGGFNSFAKRDKVVVHRRDGSTVLFNFDRAVDSQDFKGNLVLAAGDIIIVP